MSEYLTHLMVDGHTADRLEQARRPRLVHDARARGRWSGRLRGSTARFLVAVAIRLDDRTRPVPSHRPHPAR
jgi:hypothetical protein